MRFLRELYIIIKKSRAAAMLENALEKSILEEEFAKLNDWDKISRNLISDVINQKPHILSHPYGKNPTELSLVCYALALGMKNSKKETQKFAIFTQIFCDAIIEVNQSSYQLLDSDIELIEDAMHITKPLLKTQGTKK